MNKTDMNYQTLAQLLKDMKFPMMTTLGPEGAIYGRPMVSLKMNANNFDGRIWFVTKRDSPKVHAIENDQHINLAYADPANRRFISVTGQASLIEDQARLQQLWSPELNEWFPQGPNQDLSLICVRALSAEIWDPGHDVTQMVGIATAFGALGADEAMRDKAEGQRLDLGRS